MSSKRYSAMKNFAHAKKPKLDISVSRGRPPSPSSKANTANTAQSSADLRKNEIDVDFWGDDDDDVILMATQIAEAAEAERNTTTFTQFAPQCGTSTQAPLAGLEKNCLLDDDEDADFLAVIQTTKVSTFIAPSNSNNPSISNFNQTTTEARRHLALERQIKMLTERLDLVKKDNIKLKKELSESNECTEIKSGEVSMLRDELKHVRQQLKAIQIEKLALAERKASEDAKQVVAEATHFQLKNAEYRNLKMNQARDTIETKNYYKQDGRTFPRHFLRMHNLEIKGIAKPDLSPVTEKHHIFKQGPVRNLGNFKNNMGNRVGALFHIDLEYLLLSYAQLEKEQSTEEPANTEILNSVCKVFAEFWSYAHSLDSLPNRQVYPYYSYPLASGDRRSLYDLYQPQPLYSGERLIFLRRYVAILALICNHSKAIAKALIQLKHGKLSLIQIASDSVQILGFSHDLPDHFGLLEAFAVFLDSLLRVELDVAPPDVTDPLFDLLKQLVFTRPSPWVFGQLSSCMLACSRKGACSHLMAQMCVNSPKHCFVSDRVRSIYRFGPDSCLVQVYAGLLELCFFTELPLEPSHFQLLLSTCRNHVHFVYQCFQNPPEFILKMLPSINESEDDDEMVGTVSGVGATSIVTSVSVTTSDSTSTLDTAGRSAGALEECGCECYVKLCLSVVTLVFQLLHQWILNDFNSDTEEVGKISQTAVHLLKMIFRENYLTCLFRDSEETTKHYLSLICGWWTEHAKCLGFLSIHLKFLNQLQHCHFMLKPMIKEVNVENPELDLTEWNRTTDNAEAANPNKLVLLNLRASPYDYFVEIERLEEYVFE